MKTVCIIENETFTQMHIILTFIKDFGDVKKEQHSQVDIVGEEVLKMNHDLIVNCACISLFDSLHPTSS